MRSFYELARVQFTRFRPVASSQTPYPSFCLSGQKLSHSVAPPFPTKPTSLGFGGGPVGGPRWIPGVMFWCKPDVLCANRSAMVHLTRLSRLRCREANTLGVRCRLSPCLCVLRVRLNGGVLRNHPTSEFVKRLLFLKCQQFICISCTPKALPTAMLKPRLRGAVQLSPWKQCGARHGRA